MSDPSFVKRDEGVRLSWHGETSVFDRATLGNGALDRFETPPRIFHGQGAGTKGRLLLGDNRASLASIAGELTGRVTLAYMDPPFLTNRAFDAIDKDTEQPRSGPLKTRPRKFAFDDRWAGRGEYLEALGQRLALVRELLAPHGSVIVHVDPKTSHYVKVMCDGIFGDEAFASEIVWRYRRWPSKTPNYQRVHDVLLRYRKDPKVPPRWNQAYEPLAASTIATWGTNKQRAVIEEDGRRSRSRTTEEATKGVPMGDVWDIGVIAPISRERTGYPSQKPEALLQRIVSSLSDPGDIVLDPYAGSGTTIAVAAKLGREFIGMDASEVAFGIARTRLEGLGIHFDEAVRESRPNLKVGTKGAQIPVHSPRERRRSA